MPSGQWEQVEGTSLRVAWLLAAQEQAVAILSARGIRFWSAFVDRVIVLFAWGFALGGSRGKPPTWKDRLILTACIAATVLFFLLVAIRRD